MVAGNNHINKEDFLHLYPSTHERVFIQKNIHSGFAGAGLKPLNEDQVLEKITFQLCTPTPPLLEGSISSAFQTPQNPQQLDQKVRSLQRSLQKRKLSSSPVSHIQHLEKAAQMAMNMNLLLQEEIKVLRAENERKMRNKARRRANLGNDILLSVQEGQSRIQQLDMPLVEQVSEPTPIPRQRAPPRCKNRIQMAIAAIKNKKIKLVLSTTGTFSMPEPTIRARLNGRKPRSETRANGHKLIALEEEVLTKHLLDADKQGFLI
ncbi:hypothetical protein GB937_010019 [Aspergillus fischeri]|nr:hypothetical protein GB937_010019 [Aspergillus fischeri]